MVYEDQSLTEVFVVVVVVVFYFVLFFPETISGRWIEFDVCMLLLINLNIVAKDIFWESYGPSWREERWNNFKLYTLQQVQAQNNSLNAPLKLF